MILRFKNVEICYATDSNMLKETEDQTENVDQNEKTLETRNYGLTFAVINEIAELEK